MLVKINKREIYVDNLWYDKYIENIGGNMEIKNIKISENIYNGDYAEGSIFENSINIEMSRAIFDESVEKITRDSINASSFKRSFYDNNMQFVTIEIQGPMIEDVSRFMDLINQACSVKYMLIKDNNFNLYDYLNKITIKINDSEVEYELDINSSLAQDIMTMSGLNQMKDKSNKEIIEMINI